MKYSLIIIFLILTSCSDDPAKIRNRDLIERDKFINILTDMHIMDAITNDPKYFRKFDASDSVDIYSSIFEEYEVTKAEFDSTVSAYSKQPDAYLKIYDEVILELNYRLDTLKENEPRFNTEEKKERVREKNR